MKETRAEKAQRLVDEGRVSISAVCDRLVAGQIKSGPNIYYVAVYPNGHFQCTCRWGDMYSHTDDLCAHALAVRIVAERKDKP